MEDITVVFNNGNIVSFVAQEFDVNLKEDGGSTNKYSYKDAQGQDSSIHLRPNQVAGVFRTRSSGGRRALDTLLRSPPALTI
jgi:hypothetical protein